MEEQVQYRIGWMSAGFILGVAVVADLLQVLFTLLVVFAPASIIVTVVAEGIIFFYFWVCGVHFMRGKRSLGRILGFLLTTMIEMVPFLDGLPTLTADTFYNIHSARKEDRELHKEKQEQAAAMAAAEAAQQEQLARAYYLSAANDNEEDEEYREAA